MFNLYKDLKQYNAYFIDVDNTILNYTHAHNTALEKVSNQFGFSLEDYDKAKLKIKKRDLSVNHHKKELYFKIICEDKKWPFSFALDMYELYTKEFNDNLLVDKGMSEFLRLVKKDDKKVIAITNFYVVDQIRKLNCSGLSHYIDHLITSEEFEVEKPNELLLNEALRLSGVDKSEAVMIGDSIVDDSGQFGVDYYPYNCSKLLISVSGKSGAGKSTITKVLRDVWRCKVIEGDGYHKYERNHPEWANLTHYNPTANNLIQLGLDIKHIFHDLNNINVPIYNHSNGKFEKPTELNSKDLDVVVVDGLHSLYKEVTGDFVKIKIFIDNALADDQKIKRDTVERNKSIEAVITSIESRKLDYERYISVQKEFSNFVVDVDTNQNVVITIKNDLVLGGDINGRFDSHNNFIIECTYEELSDIISQIMNSLKNNRYVNGRI